MDKAVPNLELLSLVILLVREWHEQTGSWPTATQLRASILKPV